MSVVRRALCVIRRESSVVLREKFALKAYSSYTPRPIGSKLGSKHRGVGVTCKLKCIYIYIYIYKQKTKNSFDRKSKMVAMVTILKIYF